MYTLTTKGLSKNNLDDSGLNYTGTLGKLVYLILAQTLKLINIGCYLVILPLSLIRKSLPP